MALPTTIQSTAQVGGFYPPRKSSGGSFYAVSINGTGVDVFKATDPTSSWAIQDAANNPVLGVIANVVSQYQDGDVLHIATAEVSGANQNYRYHTFNMATDAWVITNEVIETITTFLPLNQWISISVRSDGDVVVAYNGASETVHGAQKERIDLNVRTGGTWGGPVAIDDASAIHFGNPVITKGPLTDDMHLLWTKTTGGGSLSTYIEYEARTLDPSDVLSTTIAAINLGSTEALTTITNAVSYEDAGTQRMCWAYTRNAGSINTINSIRAVEDGSDDISTLAARFISSAQEVFANGNFGVHSIGEENGNLHALYSGGGAQGVDQDIYYMSSTNDGALWGSLNEEMDAITCNWLSGHIYIRGVDTVFAYIYDDAGVQKYNEKILVVGEAPSAFPYHIIKERRRSMKTLLTM